MPFLKEQVDIINNALIATAFNYKQFKSALIENIAKSALRTDGDNQTVYPAVISISGVEKYLGIDDTYPMVVYHKIVNKRYEKRNNTTQYGAGFAKMFEITTMYMVVYASQAKISLTAEQLEALIVTNFPDRIPDADISTLTGVEMMNVNLISSELDGMTIFAQEYKNVEYPLGIEDILIRINYSTETAYKKDCLNICEPC